MSIKLFNHRSLSLIVLGKRSVTIQANFDFGKQLKSLNDNKQFKKTLALFDNYTKSNTETLSSQAIIQALKACTKLRDVQRGEIIHHQISSHFKGDAYVVASLIHFYSKFSEQTISLFCINLVQCGEMTHAQSLFDAKVDKTYGMYGAMMKGNYSYTYN